MNAFQGREKDAIVVTFVRSNPDQELGFVADERRLTVAVTRARRQLVLIGDSATLDAPRRGSARCSITSRSAGPSSRCGRSRGRPRWSDSGRVVAFGP